MERFTKPTRRRSGLQYSLTLLEVSHGITVSMLDYARTSVAHAASLAGREIDGRFSVHCDWDRSQYVITRTA